MNKHNRTKKLQYTNQDIKPSTNGGITNDISERAIGSKRLFGFWVFVLGMIENQQYGDMV